MREMRCRDVDLHTMNAGISNVIYMELYSGPKMANGRCGKTIDTGTIDRGSTVYSWLKMKVISQTYSCVLNFLIFCEVLKS